MKVSETRPDRRTAVPPCATAPEQAGGAAAPAHPVTVAETAACLGIPPGDLAPPVAEGVRRLLLELERLRHDNAVKEQRIAELERLADEDPLAPVLNRRAFLREVARMIAYGARYGVPSSLLFFDVNGMKRINDRYGHGAGDAALTHVAAILLRNVRGSDAVGRLGGDEFGVLLVRADERFALSRGAELAARIGETPLAWQGERLTLSAACGAAALVPGKTPEEILAAADHAMYRHKRQQRAAGD